MLDQEENVFRDFTRNPLLAETTLKLQHLSVGAAAKVLHQQSAGHGLRANRLLRAVSSAAAIPLRPIVTSKPACPKA